MNRDKTIGVVIGFVCAAALAWMAWDIQVILAESHIQYRCRVEGSADADKVVLGWLAQLKCWSQCSWLWFGAVLPAAVSTVCLLLGKTNPRNHLLVNILTLIGFIVAMAWLLHAQAGIWLRTFGRVA